MVSVLDVGACLAVTHIEGNVAVIARKLGVKGAQGTDLGVLECGKGNRKTLKHVVHSVHLSLHLRKNTMVNTAISRRLREKHREAISKKIRSLEFDELNQPNLTADSELDGRDPLSTRQRIHAPAISVFALTIRSQTDEKLVDHSITSTFPSIDITTSYSLTRVERKPTRVREVGKGSGKGEF